MRKLEVYITQSSQTESNKIEMFRLIVLSAIVAVALATPIQIRSLDGRIVGGEATNIEKYPYQVSLRYGGSHICGGSVLNENTILTAAHCTDGAIESLLTVRAGSTHMNTGGIIINVASIHQHPDYDFETVDYDVSVLKLRSNLPLGRTIRPIDLQVTEPSAGIYSVLTGWGTLTEGGVSPNELQEVVVPTISRAACKAVYGPTAITQRMICAGYPEGGKDACDGDSGSPLQADGFQIGIVSWGSGCARPNLPNIYSNVADLRNFIEEHL